MPSSFHQFNMHRPNISLNNPNILNHYEKSRFTIYPQGNKQHTFDMINRKYNFSTFRGFKEIRNLICKYIYQVIGKNESIDVDKVAEDLINELTINEYSQKAWLNQIPDEKFIKLKEDILQYPNYFKIYFKQIVIIISELIKANRKYRLDYRRFNAREFTSNLINNGITLDQRTKVFTKTIIEIFDSIKKNSNDFVIKRKIVQDSFSEKEKKKEYLKHEAISIFKKKLLILKLIYNGKYFIHNKCKCPYCHVDIKRLPNIQFHHPTKKKDFNYNSKEILKLDIYEIIKELEADKVELICENHHRLKTAINFVRFKDLIMWDKLFNYSPEVIYILIHTAVNFHPETKNFSSMKKEGVRKSIIRFIKKRYLIEKLNGYACVGCGKVNIKDNLPAFHYHHDGLMSEEEGKEYLSNLLEKYNCSTIASILAEQKGGFLCGNCHSMFHKINFITYAREILCEEYDNDNYLKEIKSIYQKIKINFRMVNLNNRKLQNPLDKERRERGSLMKYLFAIYHSSQTERATPESIAKYLGIQQDSVNVYLWRDQLIENYINIEKKTPILRGNLIYGYNPSRIELNDKGKELIELVLYTENFYDKLNYISRVLFKPQ